MHVLHHDFGGYPYPAELSRELAARGHRVTHAWCSSLETTPGGAFALRPTDPSTLHFEPISLGAPLEKYNYVRRWRQERRYGRLAVDLTTRLRPDVVLSANMPLDAQTPLLQACRRQGIPFVFWLQDLLGVAAARVLSPRLPGVGPLLGRYYVGKEARALRQSNAVVPITDDFGPLLRGWGVADDSVTTIENWAPLAELPLRPKDNPWARENGLADSFVFLYAGSMGMKHDPDLLVRLAEGMRDRPGVKVVVLTQGPGGDHLEAKRRELALDNLVIRGFEPFSRMPDVMGAADVLVAILEPGAGVFSVPSKVLAYLCGAKPLLLSIPEENLAGRIVSRAHAGLVVPPNDPPAFVAAATRLLDDAALRTELGTNGRRYAEQTFDISEIADHFERVLERARSDADRSGGRMTMSPTAP